MALIICPECGRQVSDKAEICPGCGIKIAGNIVNPRYVMPQEQGQNVQQQAYGQTPQQPVQPQRPVQAQQPVHQPESTRKKEGSISRVILTISFVFAVILCSVGYYFYNSAQSEKEQEDYEYAMLSTDPMVLQAYLARYADAPQEHKDSVNAHLTMLTQSDNDWTDAVVSGTKSALENYIKNHPTSVHCGEAKNKIDSIDYAVANRANTMESYKLYLQQHPDGKYALEAQEYITDKKNTEVQPEEIAMVKSTCRHFFQAINSRNESKLLGTVTEYLTGFLNLSGASGSDVVSFMNKLYKEDITNMNWRLGDDFKIDKVKNDDDSFNLKAQFSAEQEIERTDPSKEKHAKYVISVEVTPEGKIQNFSMKKQTLQ